MTLKYKSSALIASNSGARQTESAEVSCASTGFGLSVPVARAQKTDDRDNHRRTWPGGPVAHRDKTVS